MAGISDSRRKFYWATERQDEVPATLSGLLAPDGTPRVARSSQPWAERCNPFGIELRFLLFGFSWCLRGFVVTSRAAGFGLSHQSADNRSEAKTGLPFI